MKTLNEGETFFLQTNEVAWNPSTFAKGLSVKDIAIAGGLEMQFVRMEAGAKIPVHTHELPEFIYILEGELIVSNKVLNTGCVSISAPGSQHVSTEVGCVPEAWVKSTLFCKLALLGFCVLANVCAFVCRLMLFVWSE
jgi:mannose-6-phosphate isomerase-like protein (cupin superfamily)